ncbi:ATP-binding cassette domain-containing protein [Nitratireductor indicus]|uniref:ATP-binding cassette domain-containing protein n=1 Tax=Nitratireductor indicus TaxID=721133 RepID=UPI002874E8CB|nr:ATP-binding cassette domain-containing protein [Nitratireductor indicus]MDS1136559.1 ATP-binding cassette domain-containing protein [Nitratireductor indicus]
MNAETTMKTIDETAPNWERDPVLSVQHLTMRFGGLVAVGDLSFEVGRGDITALIGPNGAGKTTVFNCVTGFYRPTEGRVVMRHGPGRQDEAVDEVTASGLRWKSSDKGAVFLLERMPDHEISHKAKVARTFQNIRLFGGMTVLENLLVAQHNPLMVASGFSIGGILGLPSYRNAQKEAIDKAIYWLERTNLVERADDPAADLPYGDQRRLEIARAMCIGPQLLCLDEPAAGLNPRESAELNGLLKYIRDEHNVSVLLIEHDMGVVMEISDHVVVLDYGVKISDGSADFVKSDPKVIAAYLGVDEESEIDMPEVLEDVEKVAEEADTTKAGKSSASSRKPAAKAGSGKASGKTPAAKKTSSRGAKVPAASKAEPVPQGLLDTGTAKAKPAARKPASRASAAKPAGTSATATTVKPAAASKATKGTAAQVTAEKPAKSASGTARAKPATKAKVAAPAASEIKIADAGNYPGQQPHGTKKPRAGGANNLTRVKGIGPANEKKLNALGIWHFDQIAAWKKAEIEWVGAYLSFPGRIDREEWVKQAKVLAKGGETEFSKRVDKGDVPTSVPGKRGAQPKPSTGSRKATGKGGKA